MPTVRGPVVVDIIEKAMAAETLIPTGQTDAGGFNDELRQAVQAVLQNGELPEDIAAQDIAIESDPSSPDGVRVVERAATTVAQQ